MTGLGGHAFGSFKSKNGWEVWLRDFLPDDIPDVRVLLYGYDTELAKSESKNSIVDLAKSLLELVKIFRDETEVKTLFSHPIAVHNLHSYRQTVDPLSSLAIVSGVY